jgi:hypothetical protein
MQTITKLRDKSLSLFLTAVVLGLGVFTLVTLNISITLNRLVTVIAIPYLILIAYLGYPLSYYRLTGTRFVETDKNKQGLGSISRSLGSELVSTDINDVSYLQILLRVFYWLVTSALIVQWIRECISLLSEGARTVVKSI